MLLVSFLETPSTATQYIYFEDRNIFDKSPDLIKMLWSAQNLTMSKSALVTISLWGYREITDPELAYIDLIEVK